jgi:hypothetical protein
VGAILTLADGFQTPFKPLYRTSGGMGNNTAFTGGKPIFSFAGANGGSANERDYVPATAGGTGSTATLTGGFFAISVPSGDGGQWIESATTAPISTSSLVTVTVHWIQSIPACSYDRDFTFRLHAFGFGTFTVFTLVATPPTTFNEAGEPCPFATAVNMVFDIDSYPVFDDYLRPVSAFCIRHLGQVGGVAASWNACLNPDGQIGLNAGTASGAPAFLKGTSYQSPSTMSWSYVRV